jgi:MoaA/NifB/PqqE/SkfB family radical SAM enzyme
MPAHWSLRRWRASGNFLRRAARLYASVGSPLPLMRLMEYYLRRAVGQSPPLFLDIAVTYRCQCDCIHCSARSHAGRGPEMDTEEMKSVLTQGARMGVQEVILSGGEALLREDLPALVRHARRLGLLTRLNTNGLLVDRRAIRTLRRAGLSQWAVSIDAADAATHDERRGRPGTFNAAVRALRLLREEGVLCQMLTYASPEDVPEGLERIVRLGREMGVLAVFAFFPMATGRWTGRLDRALTERQRDDVRAFIDFGLVHVELATEQTNCCTYTQQLLYITADGRVTPCPFVPYAIGSLRRHSLRELWLSYARGLSAMQCRGECPMNIPARRAELARYVREHAL